MTRKLSRAVLAATSCFSTVSVAAPASPYQGIYVIIDPYDTDHMSFLSCLATGKPGSGSGQSCTGISNPFTSSAANGILLRLPWCGFQTDSAANGSCHYLVDPNANAVAGLINQPNNTNGPWNTQFIGEYTQPDSAISNLSSCTSSKWDECGASVLGTALGYIHTLMNSSNGNLKYLSLGLAAGQHTPISVLDTFSGGNPDFIDLAWESSCTRQIEAWQPAATSAYEAAVAELVRYVASYSVSSSLPTLSVLKIASIVDDDLEFSVPAHPYNETTAVDPFYDSSHPKQPGPQGDAILQCPDHKGTNGSAALIAAYKKSPVGMLSVANAYEAAFGHVLGYEAGLLAANGVGTSAILSIATKGLQAFAHIDCGTDGTGDPNTKTCIPDPTPGVGNYGWSDYYFSKFVEDTFSSATTIANAAATSGFQSACPAGAHCTPKTFSTKPSQLSIVFTALQTPLDNALSTLPSCWLNNLDVAHQKNLILDLGPSTQPSATSGTILEKLTLDLGSSTQSSATTSVTILGPGTTLGWQTQTELSKSECPSSSNTSTYATTLQTGLDNGGQFIEIETDTAGSLACQSVLSTYLPQFAAPNPKTTCQY